jgi:protein gp37
MYKRFKWNPKVRYDKSVLDRGIGSIKKPSKIFMCSTHDIMGEWIPDEWIKEILSYCHYCNEHIYIFLTKNPIRYTKFNFPDNCWLGFTYTGLNSGLYDFSEVQHKVKFISIEPLLRKINPADVLDDINWLIVGGLTPNPVHEKEWVDSILQEARIPVFLKDNLKYPIERKEYP